jgi:hypothetical protein
MVNLSFHLCSEEFKVLWQKAEGKRQKAEDTCYWVVLAI